MKQRIVLATLVALTILAGACSGADEGADSSDDASTSDVSVEEAAGETSSTTAVDDSSTTTSVQDDDGTGDEAGAEGPARDQLDWVVDALNRGGLTVDEVEERFSPQFLAQVPADQIVATTPQILALAEPPYAVERFEADPGGLSGEALLLGSDDRRLSAQIVVAAAAPHLIDGLGIVPTELDFPQPIEIGAIDGRLAALGPQSSLGLYEVTSGDCVAVHEVRTDSAIVLGSVFKLWVLAALAAEIDEGRAAWDETVVVTDELRSSPDGEIYELETGTEVTLERLAEAMISISDNTATDLLLDRLGRETVEAATERIGVADPSANVPMLSTGNLFALKFAAEPPNASDYRDLDVAAKRSLLAGIDAEVLPWNLSDVSLEELGESVNAEGVPLNEPRDLDIEWFATAEDLCRTLVHLDELAGVAGLEPVATILEINPGAGVPFDRDRWPTIRFKGGSEPGVIAGAWWFEDAAGDRYVVAGGVANPDAALDELDAILNLASAIELVG